jgi:hypothetical protein
MNPLAIGEPVADLKIDPKLRLALDATREKIKRRASAQCEVLKSNLAIILNDFLTEHGIDSIAWAGAADQVAPAFALDLLAGRLAEKLAEIEFEKFLSRFSAELIERTEADSRRSQ